MVVTFITDKDKYELEQDIQCLNDKMNNTINVFTDSKYFDIDYDGLISLKPEYRDSVSASAAAALPYAISDNGVGVRGSKIEELPSKIVIPEVMNNIAVAGFQVGMFAMNMRVQEIVFPDTIREIPDSFCRATKYLERIQNTEHIEKLGERAFSQTRIKKFLFPNLKEAAAYALYNNMFLQTIDIGNEIEEVPRAFLEKATSLSLVKGGAKVKKINAYAFYNTFNLKNLSILDNDITEIGEYAFFKSRIQYNWQTLTDKGCAFGTSATPIIDNTTDYWTGSTYTPCENRLVSLFHQRNPLWVNETYGTTGKAYSSGCSVCTIAHIYSAIENVELSSPKEFEDILQRINPALLDIHPGNSFAHANTILQSLGYETTVYQGVNTTKTILNNIYNELSNGAYIYLVVSTDNSINDGHTVAVYGVNDIGEILYVDSDNYGYGALIYDDLFKYRNLLPNITGPKLYAIIAKKL